MNRLIWEREKPCINLCGLLLTFHCCSTWGLVYGSLALSLQQHTGLLDPPGKLHCHSEPAQVAAAL